MHLLAHRGDSTQAHENTLEAFQAAIDSGAHGFEFDVRLTADDVPVIHHNMMINDEYFVEDLALEQIEQINLSFHRDLYTPPTLAETLDNFAGKTYLEIHLQSSTIETVQTVYQTLQQFPVLKPDNYEITSFEPAILLAMQALDSAIRCDILFRLESWMTDEMALRLNIEKAKLANARGIHLFPHQITESSVSRLQQLGYTVHCGVTNDKDEFERIKNLGVEHILTDNIHLYL